MKVVCKWWCNFNWSVKFQVDVCAISSISNVQFQVVSAISSGQCNFKWCAISSGLLNFNWMSVQFQVFLMCNFKWSAQFQVVSAISSGVQFQVVLQFQVVFTISSGSLCNF